MIPNLFKVIFFACILIARVNSEDVFEVKYLNQNNSRILMANGNIFIHAGSDKNISFKTSSGGRIFINDYDVAELPTMGLYDKYTQNIDSVESKLKYVEGATSKLHEVMRTTQKLSTEVMDKQTTSALSLNKSQTSKDELSTNLGNNKDNLDSLGSTITELTKKIHTNACEKNPCVNGGTCLPKQGDKFRCLCPPHFTGSTCEEDVDECLFINGTDLACQNDGVCQNIKNGYKCDCKAGFHGPLCEFKLSHCSLSHKMCGAHGHCIDKGDSKYTCLCDTGFKLVDEKTNPICVDIDECEKNPCYPGVECLNLDGTFQCNGCPQGYKMIGGKCEDLNECEEHFRPCAPEAKCINLKGSFKCSDCPPGYSGDSEKRCTKDDPCLSNTCPSSATCVASDHLLDSLYICDCGNGKTFNHETNECVEEVCANTECFNGGIKKTNGTDCQCQCNKNYVGDNCEKASPCFSNPCHHGVCRIREDHTHVCVCDVKHYGEKCEFIEGQHDIHLTDMSSSYNVSIPCSDKSQLRRIFINRNGGKYYLRIVFTQFDNMRKVDSGPTDCETTLGKITLYNGPNKNHPILHTFCGENGDKLAPKLEQPLLFPASNVLLEFKGRSGDFECGYTTTNPKGNLVLPGNTKIVDCIWFIQSPADKRVQLTVPRSQMQSNETFECVESDLIIFDGFVTDKSIEWLCSNTPDERIFVSTVPFMTVVFMADIFNDNQAKSRGFSLPYQFVTPEFSCGETYENKDSTASFSGTITSPNYGGLYPSHVDCTFEILGAGVLGDEVNDSDLWIILTFDDFDIKSPDPPESGNCSSSYLKISSGSGELVDQFCNSKQPRDKVQIKAPNAVLNFHSNFTEQGQGFSVSYELLCTREFSGRNGSIQTWNFPNGGEARKCIYKINAPTGSYIRLKFNDIRLDTIAESECENYNSTGIESSYVEFDGGLKYNHARNQKYFCKKGNFNINETMAFYVNEPLKIVVESDGKDTFKGLSFEYEVVDFSCGGYYSNDTHQTLESPNYPSLYPTNSICEYYITTEDDSKRVKLVFEEFDLGISIYNHEYNDKCLGDRVEIYEYNTNWQIDGKLLARFCGSTQHPPVFSETKNMLVRFVTSERQTVARWNEHGTARGFSALFEFEQKERCMKTLTGATGIITLPNPRVKVCIFFIYVEKGNRIIFKDIPIVDFDRYSSSKSIEIYDGQRMDHSKLLPSRFSDSVITSSHHATVIIRNHFESMFSFSYESDLGCGKTIYGTSGIITSPNYPHPSVQHIKCEWKILAPQGNRIEFQLKSLDDIGSFNGVDRLKGFCIEDYSHLDVIDASNQDSNLLIRYCHDKRDHDVVLSNGNELHIKYFQNDHDKFEGFLATWGVRCHEIEISEPFGSIDFLPSSPLEKPCSWTIRVPIGNRIVVKVNEFNLPHDSRESVCTDPYLKVNETDLDTAMIMDNGNRKESKNNTYCGQFVPIELKSKHNQLQISSQAHVFFDPETRFSLSYATIGCVGEIRTPRNILIYKKDIDEFYDHFECQYKIVAPVGMRINVTINSFAFSSRQDCKYKDDGSFEGMAIFIGKTNSSGSPRKTKCSNDKESFLSDFNELFIYMSLQRQNMRKDLYFDANIEFVEAKEDEGCTHLIKMNTDNEYSIHSPNYPSQYPPETECVWLLIVDAGYHIELKLEKFIAPHSKSFITHPLNEIESEFSCKTGRQGRRRAGSLKIFEGNPESGKMLDYICNDTSSTFYEVYSNSSLVSFKGVQRFVYNDGDDATEKVGFLMTARRVCGGVADATEKPETMYLNNYNKSECNVTIRNPVKGDTKVYVSIQDFSYLNEDSSYYARPDVTIYADGNLISTNKLDHHHIFEYEASNDLLLNIRGSRKQSSQTIIKYGLADHECGGPIIGRHKMIQVEFDKQEKDCEWYINNTLGNSVDLSIRPYKLPQSENCFDSYLEVRENNATGKLLSHQCVFDGNKADFSSGALYVHLKYRSSLAIENEKYYFDAILEKIAGVVKALELPPILTPPDFDSFWPFKYKLSSKDETGNILLEISNVYLSQSSYIKIEQVSDLEDKVVTYDDYSEEEDEYAEDVPEPIIYQTITDNPPDQTLILPFSKAIIYVKISKGDDYKIVWKSVEKGYEVKKEIEYSDCGTSTLHATWSWQSLENPTKILNENEEEVEGYDNNLHCMWRFENPEFTGIEYRFEKLDLGDEKECLTDYIRFEGKYSRDQKHCQLAFSNNTYDVNDVKSFRIHFITDNQDHGAGFKLFYRLTCKSLIVLSMNSNLEYRLASPPTNESRNCRWTVYTESRRNIVIEMIQLDIEKNQSCSEENRLQIKKYGSDPIVMCGSMESLGNNKIINMPPYIDIEFRSPPSNHTGFVMKIFEKIAECPSEILRIDENHPSRNIYSPEYPNYIPPSTECEYVVAAPNGHNIMLTFDADHFDFNFGHDVESFVEVRDGSSIHSPLIGKYSGLHAPSTITSSGNYIFMRLHTGKNSLYHQFAAKVELAACGGSIHLNENSKEKILKSPGYPGMFKPPINCQWKIRSKNTHMIEFKVDDIWGRPLCDSSLLMIAEKNSTRFIKNNCDTETRTEFIRSSSNELTVIFNSTKNNIPDPSYCAYQKCGFKITFRMSNEKCGGVINDESGNITLPGYPDTTLQKIKCIWRMQAKIGFVYAVELKFTGQENYYKRYDQKEFTYLTVMDTDDYRGELIIYRKFDDTKTPIVTYSDSAYLVYDDWFAQQLIETKKPKDISSLFTPFIISYRMIPATPETSGCTMLVNENKTIEFVHVGEKTSQYERKKGLCHVKLEIPENYKTMNIRMRTSNNFEGDSCEKFYMKIKSNGPIHHHPYSYSLCDATQTINKKNILSVNKEIDLFYMQAWQIENNVTYFIDVEFQNCGGYLKEQNAEGITSPNYGQSKVYSPNSKCQWLIEAPPGQQVRIRVVEMDIHYTNDCKGDRLSIGEGREGDLNEIHSYCQTSANKASSQFNGLDVLKDEFKKIQSKSRFMIIVWSTDETAEKSGWKLEYEFVNENDTCGYHQKAMSGSIHYPTTLKEYQPNQNCVWDIQVPSGYHILIHYKYMNIQKSTNCEKDQLVITQYSKYAPVYSPFEYKTTHDGTKVEEPLCGIDTPRDWASETPRINLNFVSDDTSEGRGFQLQWQAVCGANYTSSKGVITSSDYPHGYSNEAKKCEYIINAEQNDYVGIMGKDLDIAKKNGVCEDTLTTIGMITGNYMKFCNSFVDHYYREPVKIIFETKRAFLRGFMKNNRGFKIAYEIGKCGESIYLSKKTKLSKVVESHITSTSDHSELECIWNISTTPDRVLVAKFEIFEVNESNDKPTYLEFFDSSVKNNTLGRFYGLSHLPDYKIRTTSSSLIIQLMNNHEDKNFHFKIVVTSSVNCGGELYALDEWQSLTLPRDQNGNYPGFLECRWMIKLEQGAVRIRISEIDTNNATTLSNGKNQCQSDALTIVDGYSEHSPLLTPKLCSGITVPSYDLVSSQNMVLVTFVSNLGGSGKGFNITYSSENSSCDKIIPVLDGTGFSYESQTIQENEVIQKVDERCTFLFFGNVYEPVVIEFKNISLPLEDCEKNYISIQDVGRTIECLECQTNFDHGRTIRLCPNEKIQTYYSKTNRVSITVVTELQHKKKSFLELFYHQNNDCHRIIDTNEFGYGNIKSPRHLEANATCITMLGNIMNPSETKKIHFYFPDIALANEKTADIENCTQNSFAILETENRSLLYCGGNEEFVSYLAMNGSFVGISTRTGAEEFEKVKYRGSFHTVQSETADTIIFSDDLGLYGRITNVKNSNYSTQIFTIHPPMSHSCNMLITKLNIGSVDKTKNCDAEDEYLKIEMTNKTPAILRGCSNEYNDYKQIVLQKGDIDRLAKITFKTDERIENEDEKEFIIVWNCDNYDPDDF